MAPESTFQKAGCYSVNLTSVLRPNRNARGGFFSFLKDFSEPIREDIRSQAEAGWIMGIVVKYRSKHFAENI